MVLGNLMNIVSVLPLGSLKMETSNMDILETIRRPWKHPMEYMDMLFWFVIFIIAAYAMFDGMRIATSFIRSTAKEIV